MTRNTIIKSSVCREVFEQKYFYTKLIVKDTSTSFNDTLNSITLWLIIRKKKKNIREGASEIVDSSFVRNLCKRLGRSTLAGEIHGPLENEVKAGKFRRQ